MPVCPKQSFSLLLLAFQVILLILFATLGDYGAYEDPTVDGAKVSGSGNSLPYFYPSKYKITGPRAG